MDDVQIRNKHYYCCPDHEKGTKITNLRYLASKIRAITRPNKRGKAKKSKGRQNTKAYKGKGAPKNKTTLFGDC